MNICPGCGEDHSVEASGDHQADLSAGCHRSALLPCPRYFTHLCQPALVAALPGYGSNTPAFLSAVRDLNDEGYIIPAYFTWMALMGRYAVNEGTDRDEAMRRASGIKVPPGAPAYLHQVSKLVNFSTRAAILGDGETVAASFEVARKLDAEPLMTVLLSAAASAHFNVEYNDACTTHHLYAFHLLGSQVFSGAALVALPYLVDMVVAAQHEDMKTTLKTFSALAELPGVQELIAAVNILGRVLGQMIAPDVTVISTNGRPTEDGSGRTWTTRPRSTWRGCGRCVRHRPSPPPNPRRQPSAPSRTWSTLTAT